MSSNPSSLSHVKIQNGEAAACWGAQRKLFRLGPCKMAANCYTYIITLRLKEPNLLVMLQELLCKTVYDCLFSTMLCHSLFCPPVLCRIQRSKALQPSSRSSKMLPRNSTICGEAEREIGTRSTSQTSSPSSLLPAAWFSTDREHEHVTRFYLLAIFLARTRQSAAASLVAATHTV